MIMDRRVNGTIIHPTKRRHLITWLALFVLAAGLTAGCGASAADDGNDLHMAPVDSMPIDMRSAPNRVRQAYQLAAGNPDIFTRIPCYCGCSAMGHTSNYDCYVSGVTAGGSLTYDPHALVCTICVDITHDTVRLLKQGQSVPQVRDYIDANYSRFGPGTGS
jgi:hypothetical protein